MNYSETSCLAPRKTRNNIQHDAFLLRKRFGYDKVRFFPIMVLIELVLPQIDPEFYLDVVEDSQLVGILAETYPEDHCIRVKQSVYNAACKDDPWARMVMAHEVGHYYYHSSQNISYAKLVPGQRIHPERDPERQANVFAAELLAPSGVIQGKKIFSPQIISKDFGVSLSAARTQLSIAQKAIKKKKAKKMVRQNTQP